MPRITEGEIGRVVGPLRMKVHHNTTQSPKIDNNVSSSIKQSRRGRYSRKSNHSVSPAQASLLFGKPIEDDEGIEKTSTSMNVLKSAELRMIKQTANKELYKFTQSSMTVSGGDRPNLVQVKDIRSSHTSPPYSQRHALAIDTRILVSINVSEDQASNRSVTFINQFKKLVKTLHERGIFPDVLTTTTTAHASSLSSSSSKPRNKQIADAIADLRLGIKSYKFEKEDHSMLPKIIDPSDRSILSQVDIETTSSELNASTVSIPLQLHATYSWLIFSSMVDSILAETTTFDGFVSSKSFQQSSAPVFITIVCSDTSLFCDTNIDSHRNALKGFLHHIAPYFDQGLLNSIRIVVAASNGQIGLTNKDHSMTKNSGTCGSIYHGRQDKFQHAMRECILMIEETIDGFESEPSRLQNESMNASLRVSLSVVQNCSVDFMALSHSLVCQALSDRNMQLSCRLRNIDLPASTDGTNCCISFEASYQIFPFPVSSCQAKMLSNDLKRLAMTDLVVVQLLPLSSIDASLLFGIPIAVRAGMSADYNQYREMNVLVRSLFRILQKQEQAILLRGTINTDENNNLDYDGLFHNNQPVLHFVLMAQEIPTNLLNDENTYATSDSGLLFQIAQCDQLLHNKNTVYMSEQNDVSEEDIQFMEHIENSLSTLPFSTYNPYLEPPYEVFQSQPDENAFIEGHDKKSTNTLLKNSETYDTVPTKLPPPMDDSLSPDLIDSITSNDVTKLSIYDLDSTMLDEVTTKDVLSEHNMIMGE